MKSYEKRENWQWDVGAQYRKATLPDGTDTSIVFAWLKTSTGIPNPLLPGTALYGGHFLYGKNARPALGGDTIEKWFTDHEPKNQIEIDKWEGNLDSTAIGFGLVLGTQVDRGRPWNLQLGLLWTDSQWLLHGYLNIFKQRPDPADTQAGSLRLLGAWGRGHLFGSVRWTENVPADGKVMKIDLGAELLVDDASDQTHFYAGFHWPPERHLKAILFERYEVSFYLMQDDADVENFAGTGLTLPGFVAALGARFSIEGGRKKGRLKLYFYFRARADLAFAGSDPMLTVVRASVAGGIVAKAYGIGFELEAAAEFLWVRPQPDILTGKIKITLDLPWPIPNLHYTLDISDGTDEPTEDLQTAHRRADADSAPAERRDRARRRTEPGAGPGRSGVRAGVFLSNPQRRDCRRQLSDHRGRPQCGRYDRHARDERWQCLRHRADGDSPVARRRRHGDAPSGTDSRQVGETADRRRRRPAVAPGAGTVLSRGHRAVAPGRPDRRTRRRSRRRVEPLPASVGTQADLLFLGRSAARTDADDRGRLRCQSRRT